eukprot:SM000140S00578  [mRNA]  locus=s140:85100:86254:+ [translate_table: standard]
MAAAAGGAGAGGGGAARADGSLIAMIADETTTRAIEDSFRDFTSREDVAIVLISQYVANMIRYAIDSYSKTLPAILEIPSKEHPYDPAQDSILSRVKHMFSSDPGGSSTRGL